jgi:hypothetical protein
VLINQQVFVSTDTDQQKWGDNMMPYTTSRSVSSRK